MNKGIYPCIWFNNNAQEAVAHYRTIFSGVEILQDNGMVVIFTLNGTTFMGLNGGPQFRPNEGVSFVIECADQEEIDRYWTGLSSAGGVESQCGWVQDAYGIWWQVVPAILGQLMTDPERRPRVQEAFMKMKKFDIQTLINA